MTSSVVCTESGYIEVCRDKGFPNFGELLRDPMIRSTALWGLRWVPLIYGNHPAFVGCSVWRNSNAYGS